MKEVVLSEGYNLNQILPTVFTLGMDGKIVSVMSSNVDDLLYGYKPEVEKCVKDIIDHFRITKEEVNEFRYCGKEFKQ